jgi:hypothetical protein
VAARAVKSGGEPNLVQCSVQVTTKTTLVAVGAIYPRWSTALHIRGLSFTAVGLPLDAPGGTVCFACGDNDTGTGVCRFLIEKDAAIRTFVIALNIHSILGKPHPCYLRLLPILLAGSIVTYGNADSERAGGIAFFRGRGGIAVRPLSDMLIRNWRAAASRHRIRGGTVRGRPEIRQVDGLSLPGFPAFDRRTQQPSISPY